MQNITRYATVTATRAGTRSRSDAWLTTGIERSQIASTRNATSAPNKANCSPK